MLNKVIAYCYKDQSNLATVVFSLAILFSIMIVYVGVWISEIPLIVKYSEILSIFTVMIIIVISVLIFKNWDAETKNLNS